MKSSGSPPSVMVTQFLARAPLATFDTGLSSSSSDEELTTSVKSPTSSCLTSVRPQPIDVHVIILEPDNQPTNQPTAEIEHTECKSLVLPGSPSISLPTIDQNEGLQSHSRYRYFVIVFFNFMTNCILEGMQFNVGVLIKPLREEFKTSLTLTSWVAGFFLGVPHLAAPIASCLVNRFGCRAITIIGAILAAVGVGLASLAQNIFVVFLTYGVIAGFGISMIDVASNCILSQYFDKQFSFVSGISVCGGGIGMSILLPFIEGVLEKHGWRTTSLVTAGMYLLVVICGLFFKNPRKRDSNTKVKNNVIQRNLYTKYIKDPARQILEPLRYYSFLIFALSNFIFFIFNDLPFLYTPKESANPTWIISIIGLVSSLGQLILGWLGDKQSMNNDVVYAVFIVLCGVTVFAMPFAKTYSEMTLTACLFGFFLSTNYALTNIILDRQIKLYFPIVLAKLENNQISPSRLKKDLFSNAYGLLLFMQGVGNLIGPAICGALNESYKIAYYVGGVFIALSGLVMFTMPIKKCIDPKPATTENIDVEMVELDELA